MTAPATFRYSVVSSRHGMTVLMPRLDLTLSLGQSSAAVSGLLDTGSTVNVLPFETGVRLGADWSAARPGGRLTGNLAGVEVKGLFLTGTAAGLPPVRLAFAWAVRNDVPLLLGQRNFFELFDVCFFLARSEFQVRPAGAAGS